jgi:hypothetical protein
MGTPPLITLVALGLGMQGWFTTAYGQAGSTPKVCALLPTAALEAHFRAKTSAVRGSETPSVSACSTDVPDRRHGADLISRPTGPTSITIEQRLAAIRPRLERQGSKIKDFGAIGCFTDQLDMGESRLSTTTCFLDHGGYLSLSLRSDDPNQLEFEAVKTLLEETAARRK